MKTKIWNVGILGCGLIARYHARNARIRRAKELLTYSDMNVTQIAESVGFCSIHHFTRSFTAAVGVSPSRYKQEKADRQ